MRRLVLVLLACLADPSCTRRMPSTPPAIVFVAKRIRTGDAARPTAQALVIRGGKLAYVGDEKTALEQAGADAAVERWPASTIVPGLVDSHAHVASLGRALSIVSLGEARSETEAVALLASAKPSSFQGEWLVGRSWDQNDWTTPAFPTRASLDAKYPTTPIYLGRVDGHAAWVNSEALKRAGITRATKDPEGGRILRDAAGEPSGVLVDNAMDLVAQKIPSLSAAALQQHLKLALETCARLGLTGVHDAGIELATFQLLQRLDLVGALPVRIYAMADGQGRDAEEFLGRGPFRGRNLELRAVKLVADGALGSRGAALEAPYSDEPAQRGLLMITPEALAERASTFAERGFQVAVHAIGDRANTITLDALAKLPPGGRHRVEHAQLLAASDVGRFAKAGIVASFQPTHATSDMPWAAARVGAERLQHAYAWRELLDSGAHVAFGSDFPVEDPNPLWGLYAARTRQDRTGKPEGGWMPNQRVSGEEALAGFTAGAAWASFSEDRRGVLEEGFDADFVVLPVDPVADPPAALLDAKVQITVVGGVDVYRAP